MFVEIDQNKIGDVDEVRVYLTTVEVRTWLERWRYEEGDTLSIYAGDTVVRLIMEEPRLTTLTESAEEGA